MQVSQHSTSRTIPQYCTFKRLSAWIYLPGVEAVSVLFISVKAAVGLNPVVVEGTMTEDLDISKEVPGRSNCNNFCELGDRGEVGVFWDLPLSDEPLEIFLHKDIRKTTPRSNQSITFFSLPTLFNFTNTNYDVHIHSMKSLLWLDVYEYFSSC